MRMRRNTRADLGLGAAWMGWPPAAPRRQARRADALTARAVLAPVLAACAVLGAPVAGVKLVRRLRAYDPRGAVVLITGGTRGLGYALAEELTQLGARVAICARNEAELARAEDALRRVAARASVDMSGAPLAVRCDVGDRAQVDRMLALVNQRLGPVDVLINNAGIISVGPLEAQTVADFEEAMQAMFWGVVHPTLAVLPQMRARRAGRIVNITSIGGKVSVPHLLPYGSAKFAAVGFSEGLSAEVAKDDIVVTTVVPGLMRTGSYINAFFKGRNDAEYTWFSLGDSLPLLSISARRAARQIVWAMRTGRSELVISISAQLIARFHGLFPGTTTRLMGLANRLLPRAGGIGEQRATGVCSETAVTSSFLTGLSQWAMRRYLQVEDGAGDDLGARSQPGALPAGM